MSISGPTSRCNIGSFGNHILVILVSFCLIIYFDIFCYIFSIQTRLISKSRENDISPYVFQIRESIVTDKIPSNNSITIQPRPQNKTFHSDFQVNGQSHKSILSIPNAIKVSDFFESMQDISKHQQYKMIEVHGDIAFEKQVKANDTFVESRQRVQIRNGTIEIANGPAIDEGFRIRDIHGISIQEVSVSMANVFPRNACAKFSQITSLHTFTRGKLCTVFTVRQELSQLCHTMIQGEINRALGHVNREWRRLPPLCARYRTHYKKRDQFEVGRWVLDSMETKKTNQTETPLTPHDVLRLLSKKTIVFFGDSWLREIFVSMLALLTGEEMDDTNRTFPQGDNRQHRLSQNRLKPPKKQCLDSGLNKQGLNISHCGWTQLKSWHSNDDFDVTMIFNFRSFYKMSKEFDDIAFGRLRNGSGNLQPLAAGYLSPWPPADLLIITEGVWGPHGVGSSLEQMKSLYYRAVSFHGPIIWVTTDGKKSKSKQSKEFYQWIRKQHTSDRVFFFDRVFDLKRATELQIPNGHGYRGDIVYSHARLLFQILVSIW